MRPLWGAHLHEAVLWLSLLSGTAQSALQLATGNQLSNALTAKSREGSTDVFQMFQLSLIGRSESILSSRQRTKCPPSSPLRVRTTVPLVKTTFCPGGRCTRSDYPVCCQGGYACPRGAKCCGAGNICSPPGGFCCGTNTACHAGETCCGNGCADPGGTCCGADIFCPEGSSCCKDGKTCARKGYFCCGDKYQCSSDSEQCCQGGGCAPKDATCCGNNSYCPSGRKCCKDDDGDYYCGGSDNTCAKTLVLDLKDYKGMEEIFENMCRGILRSALYNRLTPNEIMLSYIGKGQRKLARQNRRDAGCTGSFCAQVFGEKDPLTGKKIRWSCDEFPFATSGEGGASAASQCVPQNVNSAIGSRWGHAVRGLGKGANVRVKIKGFDCSKVSLAKKMRRSLDVSADMSPANLYLRDEESAILKNNTDAIYIDGSVYGDDAGGKVAMIIPIDHDQDFEGTLNIDYTVQSGSLASGTIMDDWGYEYGNITVTDSGQTAKASVDIDSVGVGNLFILAWADNTDVSLNYTLDFDDSSENSSDTSTEDSSAAKFSSTYLTMLVGLVTVTLI